MNDKQYNHFCPNFKITVFSLFLLNSLQNIYISLALMIYFFKNPTMYLKQGERKMKLITIIVLAMFYIGCGGQKQVEVKPDLEGGDLGGLNIGMGEADIEIKEGSVVFEFKTRSYTFDCVHENVKGATDKKGQCFCEVFANGKSISYANNRNKWCDERERELLSNIPLTFGKTSSYDVHVGKVCGEKSNEEDEDGSMVKTFVCN